MLLALVAVAGVTSVVGITPVPSDSRQMLVSVTEGWNATSATVRLFDRAAGSERWRPRGWSMRASIGRAGLAWGLGLHPTPDAAHIKKEGDGRSPAGVFKLTELTGYEPEALAGARLPYRQATPTLRCVDDPKSRYYNEVVDEATVKKDWTSAEDMRRPDDLYRFVVVVAHNASPAVPGSGSCIFLHLRDAADAVTAGCTAVDEGPMKDLLRRLDPTMRPVLVQMPRTEYEKRREAWNLPRMR